MCIVKTGATNIMGLRMKTGYSTAAAVLAAGLCLLACAAGCSTPWSTISRNLENSRNLRVGMTKEQVLEIMGEPIRDEKFCEPDVWFYYIDMVWGDGLITEDECMPLVFKDGKLIGWGNDFRIDYRLKLKGEPPTRNPKRRKEKR